MKRREAANDNLASSTTEVWQPRLGRPVSANDAADISFAVVGFFSVLAEWGRAELPPTANDAEEAPAGAPARPFNDR